MEKISIVLLNYLNYTDTLECVNSILDMEYELDGIVIVDNHSDNESFKILYKKYAQSDKIIVVRTGKNYGFAKGNNIGIRIARERFGSDFVFVANNDILFMEKDYFNKLLGNYSGGVGVIGSEIHTKGKRIQRRVSIPVTLHENLILYKRDFFIKYTKGIWVSLPSRPGYRVMALHGCALLLTPDFFKYYRGFYERTFLYNEEEILYFMCKKHDLEQIYVRDTYIYHKEDRSSELSFHNDNKVRSSYTLQSRKYVLWWIIKDKFRTKFIYCKKVISDIVNGQH